MPDKDFPFSTVRITPPIDGTCKICASKHPAEFPHNRFSLYYMMRFRREHGRLPTAEDAMKHCGEETRRMIHYVLTGEDAQ
ncbi:MAG: hypothetical protein E7322_05775 [Clostridiales bacterium]|nr:hypothetical protein [Clostridiales bacterium]